MTLSYIEKSLCEFFEIFGLDSRTIWTLLLRKVVFADQWGYLLTVCESVLQICIDMWDFDVGKPT